jgi:hypothetical protein
VVVQLPQVAGLVMSVSHPALELLEHRVQPTAHDVVGTEQTPAMHEVGPLT